MLFEIAELGEHLKAVVTLKWPASRMFSKMLLYIAGFLKYHWAAVKKASEMEAESLGFLVETSADLDHVGGYALELKLLVFPY